MSDDWRSTDHTAEVGMTRASIWRSGALSALEQARNGGKLFQLWVGVLQFVHCMHHMRKCVEMASVNASDDVSADIKLIIAEFDRAVPDLKIIRDVLEHYEDGYVLGKGDAQQPGVRLRKRLVDGDKSEGWRAEPGYVHGDMQKPMIRVNEFELQLVPAMDAAESMMWSLYRRIRRRDSEAPDVGANRGGMTQ